MDIVYKRITDVVNNNKAEFINANLPVIRTVDIYRGQPEDPENFEFFLPSVFVDWQIIPGQENNPHELNIDLHLVQDPGNGTENFSVKLDAGLEYLLILKTFKKIMNRLKSSNSTPFVYNGERPRVTDYFRYHIVSYKCLIDADNESIHALQTTDVTLTDMIASGKIENKKPAETSGPIIDMM